MPNSEIEPSKERTARVWRQLTRRVSSFTPILTPIRPPSSQSLVGVGVGVEVGVGVRTGSHSSLGPSTETASRVYWLSVSMPMQAEKTAGNNEKSPIAMG